MKRLLLAALVLGTPAFAADAPAADPYRWLEEIGAPATYYENVEGGHSAAANLEQRVKRYAIEYTFLLRALFGRG